MAVSDLEIEKWVDIPGWEGFYRASSMGRVERLTRFVNSKNGSFRLQPGRILRGNKAGDYLDVQMVDGARTERLSIHVLVCQLFNGGRPFDGAQVCHNDGNPHNNRSSNLRWGSAKDNASDRYSHGTHLFGEKAGSVKLTEAQVVAIRSKYVPKYGSLTKLARQYGVTSTQILNIVKRRQWAHLGEGA